MSLPRIFLSSTCYDLSPYRGELQAFLMERGFDVLNSESSTFGVTPHKHSHSACIDQVKNADYLILIIGGRRGGTFIGSEKSITNEEYSAAIKLSIPIMIFVKKDVWNNITTYKKNPSADFSPTVDDKRVFHFIDHIQSSVTDNWIKKFESIGDIKTALTAQLSYYLLLYSQGLRTSAIKEKTIDTSKLAHVALPSNLEGLSKFDVSQDEETAIRKGLKHLHKKLSGILSSATKNDGKIEKLKCLWIIAKYGRMSEWGDRLIIDNDVFKDLAWSTTRGTRVFRQLASFGINGSYNVDDSEEGSIQRITLEFDGEKNDCEIAASLQLYVRELSKKYGDDGLEHFNKADMRIFMDIE